MVHDLEGNLHVMMFLALMWSLASHCYLLLPALLFERASSANASAQMKTFGCSLLCLWQLLSQWVPAQGASHNKVAATGSSVQFPGTDKEFENLNWEFSTPSRTLPITDVVGGRYVIFEKYKNRIEVNIPDGSFLLQAVDKADSGQYKMTVDLDPRRTRILSLEVFDPLSTPSINDTSEGNRTVLSCTVQRGIPTSILWTREEVVLPVDQRQSLSDGNKTLTIWNTQESDSGCYTCTMENQVSWNISSYQLVIKNAEPRTRARLGLYPAACLVCTSVLVLNVRLVHG
ncbi:carcinoembryonic antigen-related cell adhesion molecule 2-like isoform X1 [Pristis pectinata]|uniref:carcinoembryonic antigen-related cell adhesion molecule 2-like isoform X1 n=2 Tax=Pristis pectinata TaxID=685728 RepID=UPI00223E68DB|nr:carcinoembryonic antigen-related cell adhesion molecule 2-like isoform X1 [Pristis pectinata]XP_051899580.1 carcinoembryonic antigen-related cell adhesion molecule 2-like isoform X1 [Pristis pectinata]